MTLKSYIRAMPKVELHLHLEGAIGPETLLILGERNGIELPFETADELRAPRHYANFEDFARVLLMHVRCLRRPEDLGFAVYRLGADLAAENVRYAEVTWTPQLYLGGGLSPDVLLDAMNDGRARARADFGVDLAWIPDLVRSVPAPADRIGRWACAKYARDNGVVALGLGGPEMGNPPELFEAVFRRAWEAGLPAVPHAGEKAGAQSIRGALTTLKAVRLGHGVRAIESPSLVRYLADRQIPLEVCPTSNIRLRVFPSYAAHPLGQLMDAGCAVTINSDDPALFGTSLSDEYLHAIQDCGLTLAQLEAAALRALEASFLAESRKSSMLEAFRKEYGQLKKEHLAPHDPV